MPKQLREFFESIAYAGLKPDSPRAEARRPRFGWLGRRMERLISGRAPSDPLYLTNRTLGQKMRSWAVLAVPCLVLAMAIGIALSHMLEPPAPRAAAEPTSGEVAAKMLPNLSSNLKIERNSELDVTEVRIEHSGTAATRIAGAVRNTTNHDIASAVLAVDLADETGSQLGSINVTIEGIPATKSKEFSAPVAQTRAAFALVREITPGK
ncbi:MAG TPA: FxLYD domain-containing protein [Verrucomicrobiae bacterium]|nr:FxLYD domain-containing protein [Verrucomicrobiae bacterium]